LPLATIKKGFTLVELAMVLVIIGLFAGGILVGKDLIHAAEIRSQIKQFQEYEIAYNTFKIKYNCTVGDCPNATSLFGSTDSTGTAITNGNGNGRIDTTLGTTFETCGSNWGSSPEMYGVFQQLYIANLVSFIPTSPTSYVLGASHPSTKLNVTAGLFFGADYNFLGSRHNSLISLRRGVNAVWLVRVNNSASICASDDDGGVFLATDLQQIDQKLDDGVPLSGKLIGFGGGGVSNWNCLNGNTYDLSYTTPQCQAAYVVE
jgi:prepilin-type N-terminal cleavage/methylation domain-containing protein